MWTASSVVDTLPVRPSVDVWRPRGDAEESMVGAALGGVSLSAWPVSLMRRKLTDLLGRHRNEQLPLFNWRPRGRIPLKR